MLCAVLFIVYCNFLIRHIAKAYLAFFQTSMMFLFVKNFTIDAWQIPKSAVDTIL